MKDNINSSVKLRRTTQLNGTGANSKKRGIIYMIPHFYVKLNYKNIAYIEMRLSPMNGRIAQHFRCFDTI